MSPMINDEIILNWAENQPAILSIFVRNYPQSG